MPLAGTGRELLPYIAALLLLLLVSISLQPPGKTQSLCGQGWGPTGIAKHLLHPGAMLKGRWV